MNGEDYDNVVDDEGRVKQEVGRKPKRKPMKIFVEEDEDEPLPPRIEDFEEEEEEEEKSTLQQRNKEQKSQVME